jgi:hypothetical protein
VSRPALGPTQPPVQWVPGVLSPGVKARPGRDDDHLPPSSADVVNEKELYLLSPQAPPWRVEGLLYFTFYPELLLGFVPLKHRCWRNFPRNDPYCTRNDLLSTARDGATPSLVTPSTDGVAAALRYPVRHQCHAFLITMQYRTIEKRL